jgi:REP element-mobilizing transposase RayT
MNNNQQYNPNVHHRNSIRMKGYDYSKAGLYFITICCQDRIHRFGYIENDEMVLNEYGKIAYEEWTNLTTRFHFFESDIFQIMPDHIHGIIVLNKVGATLAVAQNITINQNDTAEFTPARNEIGFIRAQPGQPQGLPQRQPQGLPQRQPQGLPKQAGASPAPTIGNIIGAYKSIVANACLDIYKSKNEIMGKLWQRNYWEHIIRNEKSYRTISDYIINNPRKWNDDKFNNQVRRGRT